MKKRLLATCLALCLLTGLMPASVLAADPGDPVPNETCTCTTRCTDEEKNEQCAACMTDPAACTGEVSQPEAPECTCEILCTEGAVNEQCAVCMTDPAACTGEAPQPEAPVCTCETLCAEGAVNELCEACMADLAACTGEAPQSEAPVCTCETLCTEGAANELCEACMADLAACTGEAPQPEVPVCTCETLCTEGAANELCEACMADLAACTGEAPQPEVPVCTCETLCTEGAANEQCAVCMADIAGCVGAEPEVQRPDLLAPTEPESGRSIYVAASGSDEKDGLTADAAVATLEKAVSIAQDGDTIYVMSDLESHSLARVTDKRITITSGDGATYTISRGNRFATALDPRSWYNPAMIEVTTHGKDSSVTLRNIVLDDGGKHEGTIFAQASSTGGTDDNTQMVQDAIVAAYGLGKDSAKIILDSGAELKNYGGMSAVRVTSGAKLEMYANSSIYDENDVVTDREKGPDGSVGPAGAVWVQGTNADMYGGTIHDVVGRAFYVDGGTVTINGEIRNIKSDVDMWNGGRGVALHLRGGADGTVGGLIEEVNPDLQNSSVIYAENSSFELAESGIIRSCNNTGAVDSEGGLIYATPDKIQDKESGQITYFDFDIYGTITGCSVQTSLIYAVNTNLAFDIGPKASITGNTCKQLCYHNTAGNDLNIYGNVSGNTCKYSVFNGQNGGYNVTLYKGAKVNDNVVTGEGGVFNFGANRNIIMQEGSEICRNTVANGALITTFGEGNCFHMEGGTISGNTVENGGLFGFSSGSWKRCSVFELQGGTITDNTAPYNIIIATKGQKVPSIYSYLLVPENGFNEVYFVQDGKTVTVDANTKLGNANDNQGSYSQPDQKVESDPRSVAELNKAAEEYCGGNQVFATFWAQNEQGTAVTVNMDDKSVFAAEKYVYVLIQETDEKGAPAENAPVQLMAAKVDSNGEISFNLPGNALGYAVGLAQPSKDYGNMTLSAPAVLSDGNKQDGTYAIDYTTTYALSPDLKAAILANGDLNDICFQVNVDSKLNVDLSKVVMDSEVFETKEVRYESDGVFTVRCTLKDGWENAANSTTTIRFTGELNERDYVVGMKLSAVGSFSATIPLSDDSELVYVPSNLVVTELVSSVTITPADITIYTGGEGYTGVVDAVGNTTTVANGIPEPGYYITLPEEFNNELGGNANAADLSGILTLKYENGTVTRTWTFELYGTEEHSTNVANEERTRYIYRLNAGVDENGKDIPIRLKLTDPENPGEEIISDDQFTPNMAEQYKAYKMSVYSGGLDPQLIVAELELPSGKVVTCGVNSDAGNLVVRGLTGADTTTEILSDETALAGSTISVVAPDTGLNYYVNGSNVELADTTGVRLLVDQVLDKGVLASYIQSNMSETIPAGNYTYDQQYMDLVDTKNGNAYLTLGEDQSLDVYWKVPDGMDSGKAFYVVHFDGLDRNYDNLSAELEKNGPDVVPATLETVNGMQYIKFEAESFSPFVLVYEQKAGTVDPGDPTYPGSEDDDYTLHYVTNGGKHLSTETKSQSWTKDYEDLPVPVREGYTFDGWYWDLRLTDPVRGDVKVDKSMVTLYAKWSGDEKQPVDTGVSRWLDTVNHTAYLSGYPDGTFGTDRNMTRAEVAQMFYALLLDKDVEITTSFSDVPADAWYAKAVNTLSSLGMLGGYPDGTYRPDAPITRAEFAAVALAFARESASASCSYADVSTNVWYYTYVAQASTYGWIGGYPDNTFRPDNKITRAEVCVIVNNMLGRAADQRYIDRNADELTSFADLTSGHWAYYTVMEATNSHKYSVDDGVESWSRVN